MSLQTVTSNLHQGRIYPELGSLGLNLDCKMYSRIRAACCTHHHRDERVEAHPIKEEMLMDVISFHLLYFLLCFAFFDSFCSFCHSCTFSYLLTSTPACTCIYKCSFFSIVCLLLDYVWGSSVCLFTKSTNGLSLLCFPRTIYIYSHILTFFPLSLFLITASQL